VTNAKGCIFFFLSFIFFLFCISPETLFSCSLTPYAPSFFNSFFLSFFSFALFPLYVLYYHMFFNVFFPFLFPASSVSSFSVIHLSFSPFFFFYAFTLIRMPLSFLYFSILTFLSLVCLSFSLFLNFLCFLPCFCSYFSIFLHSYHISSFHLSFWFFFSSLLFSHALNVASEATELSVYRS
jgi:hypothetical protein